MPNPPNFVAGAAGAPARATYDDRDQRRAVDPLAFGDTATQFQTQLIIPTTWLEGFGEVHTVAITATNIWGNSELVAFVTVPEPGKWWIIFAPLAGIPLAAWQRRGQH